MEFNENLKAIILAIIALLAGIAITIRIKKSKQKKLNKVKQKGNIVGGDLAGRDINKK